MNKKILIILCLLIVFPNVLAYDYEETIDLVDFPFKDTWVTNISISTANTTMNISSSTVWLTHQDTIFFDIPTDYILYVNISLANSIVPAEYEEIVTLYTNYGTSHGYTFFFNVTDLYEENTTSLEFEIQDKYTYKKLENVEIELYLNDTLMYELKTNNKGKAIFDELKLNTCYVYVCELEAYFNSEELVCTDNSEEDVNIYMTPQEINYEDLSDEKQLEIAYDILQKLANKSMEEDKDNENKIIIEPKIIQTIPYSQGMWSMMLKCDTQYIDDLEDKYNLCDSDKYKLQRSNKRLETNYDNLTATYEQDTKGHVHVLWAILPFIIMGLYILIRKLDARFRNSCRG